MARSSVGTGSLVTIIDERPWSDASNTVEVDGGQPPFRRLAADRRAHASVALKPAGRSWIACGTDEARGIVPESLTAGADEHGPLDASFTLARDPRTPWSEVRAVTPCRIEVAGVRVWSGRVQEAPGERGARRSLTVSGRGGQEYLADDQVALLFARNGMTGYVDQRSILAADLSKHRAGVQVQAGDGVITLIFPAGFAAVTGDFITATLDLGAMTAKRVVVTWERVGGADANATLYSRASSSSDASVAGDDSTVVLTSAGSTFAHTFSAARRYHHLIVYRNGGAGTYAGDTGVRITSVQLFGETAYESGNASVLKASQVMAAVRALCPQLAADDSLIETSTFSIPHLASGGYNTLRSLAEAANAYQDWLWGVDADLRMYFTQRPSTPLVEIGEWSGESWSGGSQSTAEDLYNRVIVSGEDPAGGTIEVVRTAASPFLDAQGITRTKQLQVGAVLTQASAEAIGDAWLNEAARTQLSGSITVQGHGSVRLRATSSALHPAHLLRHAGQRVLLNQYDPDTGGWGRVATMRAVRYTHDGEQAVLTIDNQRQRFEALIARLGALQAVAL